MIHPLEQTLGRCFSAQHVAEYLQCDITTVYRNYRILGGVKLGKTYKFFEQGLLNALLQQTAQEMAGSGQVRREEIPQTVRYETVGESLGNRKTGCSRSSRHSAGEDRHNIFGEWAVQYLDYSKLKHSLKTYEEKQRAFLFFFRSVDRFIPVDALHKRTVLDYLSDQARSRSGYAANKERKNFIAAWNWASQYIPGFPAQNPFLVERFSEERTARYVPPEKDFWKVYDRAESEQDRIMLLCFLHLAARRNEIFRLRTEDVDLGRKRVRLYTRKRKDGSRCYDWLPMSSKLHKELSVYMLTVTGDWFFPDPRFGAPYVARQHWLSRLCRKAEVPKFGLHAIRHLSASILIKNKVSAFDVQTILRHKKISTTERYIHRLESVRSAVEVF